MRRLFLLLIPLTAIILSACDRTAEPNDLVYAVALGIDKGKESGYRFTMQYAKVFEIHSGAESGKSGEEIVDSITVDAPSIYSAVDIANHLISKRFTLSHLRLVVFSEEIAREGIGDFVELMSRSREIRPDVYVAVSQGKSEDYLKNTKPEVEINPSKYYKLMYENVSSEYIPKTTNEDIYKSIAGGGRDVAMALAGMKNEEKEKGEVNKSGYEYGVEKMTAEDSEKSGVMGMGVFSGDKLVWICTSDEAKLYNILDNKFENGYITFYNEENPLFPITMRAEKNRAVKYKIDKKDDKIIVNINIEMEAEFLGLSQNYYQERELEKYEKEINGYMQTAMKDFLDKMYKSGCDVVDIKGKIRQKCLTYDEYKAYNAEEKPVEFNINSDIKINRVGLTLR